MQTSSFESQPRTWAITAGVALFLMALVAGFSLMVALEPLIHPANLIQTYQDLQANAGLFRWGLLGWLLILVLDVLVAWALYLLLVATNKGQALQMAAWRILYTIFLAIALVPLLLMALLLEPPHEAIALVASEEVAQQLLFYYYAFKHIWSMGLIVFGGHLLSLGRLLLQYKPYPKGLAYLMLLAGLGYTLVHLGFLLWPSERASFEWMEKILGLPMALGELSLAYWLLRYGAKTPNDVVVV